MSDALNATHKVAIVHLLRSVAPGLAALHAVRLRKQLYAEHLLDPPAVSPLTCPRCGHTSLSIRTRHKGKKRRSQKVNSIERTCSTCMFVEALPQVNSPPRLSRKAAALVLRTSSPSTTPHGSFASAALQQTKSNPEPQPAPKRSHKKKSGLQELLARNRAREEQQRQKQAAEAKMKGSLSSFLDGL